MNSKITTDTTQQVSNELTKIDISEKITTDTTQQVSNELTKIDISEKVTTEFNYDHLEPILMEENSRFTVFPIHYPKIWKEYKKQQTIFWKVEEIDFSKDYDDFLKLIDDEKKFVKKILAFFAGSDGIVNFNLRERFLKDVKIMEAQVVYSYQMMMENVHNEAYSQMLQNIVKDPVERDYLFNAFQHVPSIKLMSDWALKWIQSTKSFAYRLIAFAIVEGIFFSGAFASIYWLKRFRSKGEHFLNGLIKSNEFIARDEGRHADFACLLYSHLLYKLPSKDVYDMMDEAVQIAKKFNEDAIPVKLIGMNSNLLSQYIEFISDHLLIRLGYQKKYNATNPFKFMETIGLRKKDNFFEKRPTEYQSAYTSTNTAKKHINILESF